MSKDLAKAYAPNEIEQKWSHSWEQGNHYRAEVPEDGSGYSILMPPPNVTGMLTMGHVLNNTIQDIYIRWNRMRGKAVCWFPGLDHAGIATQTKVEQELRKEKLTRHDLGREAFLERVWSWKENYGGIILKQLRSLGVSADWSRTLFTMDESASRAVEEVFIRLFDEGLIYRGKRIINWSPVAMSALSDEEVTYKEVKEQFVTLRYHLEDGSATLLVGTVRPETIFGDVAVAVHPEDERYKSLIGKRVRVPLVGRLVPIIADAYVDMAFGTGCLKVTPAHDPNDFEIGLRHGLEVLNAMNPDGTLNDVAGDFAGMERFAARKKVIEHLQEQELLEKSEDYTHNVGFSERGGEPVEPFLSDQWFVRMAPLAAPALKVVEERQIVFYPEHWTKTYQHWMSNIRDWCISRQLWWGHRIPVYYAEDGSFTAARSAEEACAKLGLPAGTELRRDTDVLDTWFSSWLWPLTTMGWLADGKQEDSAEMRAFLPTDLLVTGPDIIFFWVARMIMATTHFKGQIPFKDVYFTSIIRDGKGRKMSKSLGNSPDPLDLIAKYGADAVRFTTIYLAPIGTDVKMTVNDKTQDVQQMELGRNFANKIWNAARFLLMKQEEAGSGDSSFEPGLAERWIARRFDQALVAAEHALQSYKLHDYSKKLYEFIWNDFCDWYVEVFKVQFNQESDAARRRGLVSFALSIFERVMRLLHPVMPYITEELWHAVSGAADEDTIAKQLMPKPIGFEAGSEGRGVEYSEADEKHFARMVGMIEEIRALRGQFAIAPHIEIPCAIAAADAVDEELFAAVSHIVVRLCRLASLEVKVGAAKPAKSLSAVYYGAEAFLAVDGIVDLSNEKDRLEQEIQRLEKMSVGIEKKLQNEQFVANAPEDIVAYERDKLDNMRQSVVKLRRNIADLGL